MPIIEVTPLKGPFGASVSGVDVSCPDSPETSEELRAALAEHHVLVIEDVPFTDAQFAKFGRIWGEPIKFFNPRDRDREHPEIILISNSPKTPTALRDGAMHWHQDSTYEHPAAEFTMLSAVEAPIGANSTLFADLTAAFESLPADRRAFLRTLRVIHDRAGSPQELMFDDERRGSTGGTPGENVVVHPLVIRHPITGRDALYGISGTPTGIEGVTPNDAYALLRDLKSLALQAEFRQEATAAVGCVLIWDNLAVMHRATTTEYSDEPGHRRRVRRISTHLTDLELGNAKA